MKLKNLYFLLFVICFFSGKNYAQNYWDRIQKKESTLGVEEGFTEFSTPSFNLKLVSASQTIAGLYPASAPGFNFTTGERIEIRDKDSIYYLGDINFRIKQEDGTWRNYSTAYEREKVEPLEVSGNILAAANLAATLPTGTPVKVKRFYEKDGENLVLRFEISNPSSGEIEIGALGVPMAFNNILEGKSLDETHADNVFFDPYIGLDAGYMEVKRLSGEGPVLLVLPEENMPFEAYRPLLDDPTPRSIVFEGVHEWMAHSKAYAEEEWKGVQQWNKPTSVKLQPGESRNFSLKFVLAQEIQKIQDRLEAEGHPVAVGIPGYVLPMDQEAKLFLKYKDDVVKTTIEPRGSLEIIKKRKNIGQYEEFEVKGRKWGRARLTIEYRDGLSQTVNYKVIKSETKAVGDLGEFLTTEQWFDKEEDIFNRNPSVISYDYETRQQITQDSRAWVAGLSDEAGAGSWLAAIMKQLIQPDKEQVDKLQEFIEETLWGGIQYSEGERKYGVKKSIFYYEPDQMPEGTYSDSINYNTWAAWNLEHANDPGRSYNYPHVAAAHWVMYRLARYNEGLVTNRQWDWYLKNAYHTAIAMTELAPYYAQFGQMEGTVFLLILEDLKREDLIDLANNLEGEMKERADHWRSLNYPFGSEMPWDSTGQEEVYMWSDYFGYDEKAQVTLKAILAYMPTMPHWAYNGNARRYWDFLYGGKLSRVERQIHHYGSGLNAIPVLKAYRDSHDLYLLRVGYGGLLGSIANITEDGFGPAAFHSFPSTLDIDYISGDYGSGFFGYAVNTATYLTDTAEFGWLVFGGNLRKENNHLKVDLTTAARNRIYIAPRELWITLDAGTFKSFIYNEETNEVEITLNPQGVFTHHAYLRANKELNLPHERIRGAYKIPLLEKEIKIRL